MIQKILIVDDELAMRERLRHIVVGLGHADLLLLFADSIAQAKALTVTSKLSLALIDIGLPDGSGVDLIGWLRLRDEAVPILVISAWNTEEVIVSALRQGATGYVLKERDDVEIMLCLRSVLQGGARSIRLSPSASWVC